MSQMVGNAVATAAGAEAAAATTMSRAIASSSLICRQGHARATGISIKHKATRMPAQSLWLTLLATIILGTDLAISDAEFLQQRTSTAATLVNGTAAVAAIPIKATATTLIMAGSSESTASAAATATHATATTTIKMQAITATQTTLAAAEVGAGAAAQPPAVATENAATATTRLIAASQTSAEETADTDVAVDAADASNFNASDALDNTLEHPPSDSLTKGFLIPTFLPPFPAFAMADLPSYVPTTTRMPVAPTLNLQQQQQQQLYLDGYNQQQQQAARSNLTLPATNVSVQVGSHAYLPCHIRRLMNKPVSWVRVRDGHILSVDQTTFIADQRFQSIFKGEFEYTWSLQIKYVQANDEGWYECQVATEPKMSAKVFLSVVVPTTELIGDQNRFVKAGSKVALHCIVRGTLDPPTYIIWFRGKMQIMDENKLGWFTQIDRNIFGNTSDNQNTIGSLIIPFVRKKDSGNYTCQPSNSAGVSVDLHVLSGEYSASAIMSAAQTYHRLSAYCLLLILLLLALEKT